MRSTRIPVTLSILGVATACILGGSVSARGVAPTTAPTSTPTVILSPASGFYNREVVEVKVAANTLFSPNASIKILECQAGATSDAQCDGNTQNADSIIVGADGSFDYKSFIMYSLPNSLLGEPPNNTPRCDSTHMCQLYVGQDQNDFSQPKLWSKSLSILSGPPPTVTKVSPSSGHAGHSVTLSGTNLKNATAVLFGQVASSSFSCATQTTCAAVAPPHATGTVDVQVQTKVGKSPANPKVTFTYTK